MSQMDALFAPSTGSLLRPLSDQERRAILGDSRIDVPPSLATELESMLNDEDPETRKVASELASILVLLALEKGLFVPKTGALPRFLASLARTTQAIDRCLGTNTPVELEGSERDEVRPARTTSDAPRDGIRTTVGQSATQV